MHPCTDSVAHYYASVRLTCVPRMRLGGAGLVLKTYEMEEEPLPASTFEDMQAEAKQDRKDKKEMLERVTPLLYRELGMDNKPTTDSRLDALKVRAQAISFFITTT
eukprot:6442018-Pyramimonas_sp.AAC.1